MNPCNAPAISKEYGISPREYWLMSKFPELADVALVVSFILFTQFAPSNVLEK